MPICNAKDIKQRLEHFVINGVPAGDQKANIDNALLAIAKVGLDNPPAYG